MIDLFSDTQSRPTRAMREAMAVAEVGDEQSRTDPTTIRLEERVAALLGKEASVFLPTGTMCNLVGVALHTRPGDVVVMDSMGHLLRSETGGAGVVSNVLTDPVDGDRGHFTAAQVLDRLDRTSRYRPPTSLICLEQTHNFAGGTVWPLERWDGVCDLAAERAIAVHVDGARLLNAVVASGVDAKRWSERADTVWLDFSKGLGAPMGACLAGSEETIDMAWLWKHRLGGAMRQSGLMAAAALHALDHHVDRLAHDHARASRLAAALSGLGAEVVDPDTNMVFFDPGPCGVDGTEVVEGLAERGVRVSLIGNMVRAVTHLDVDDTDIDAAIVAFGEVLSG